MTYPRFRRARAHRRVSRATGTAISLTTNASVSELAAATNGPGAGGFDLPIEAQVGDDLRVWFSMLLGNQAVDVQFSAATRVAGADVNWIPGGVIGTVGNHAWYVVGSIYHGPSAPLLYTVQAGDIASGKVTLRPYYYKHGAAARTLYSDATSLFQFAVENMGPADPE